MVKNRKCLSCGTKYSFCPDCSGADKLAPSWKSEFCSQNCMTIWTTATKYNMGKLTKSEAKDIISALNLKPASEYAPCIQRDLKVILTEEKKVKRSKKAEAKTNVVEDTTAVDAEIKEVASNNAFVEAAPVLLSTEETIHEVVNKTNENE